MPILIWSSLKYTFVYVCTYIHWTFACVYKLVHADIYSFSHYKRFASEDNLFIRNSMKTLVSKIFLYVRRNIFWSTQLKFHLPFGSMSTKYNLYLFANSHLNSELAQLCYSKRNQCEIHIYICTLCIYVYTGTLLIITHTYDLLNIRLYTQFFAAFWVCKSTQ